MNWLPEPESRQKSRHFGGIAQGMIKTISYPAKNPAILAGYAGHAILGKAIAPTMDMVGESVIKDSLITAEAWQELKEIEQQAKRKGEKK